MTLKGILYDFFIFCYSPTLFNHPFNMTGQSSSNLFSIRKRKGNNSACLDKHAPKILRQRSGTLERIKTNSLVTFLFCCFREKKKRASNVIFLFLTSRPCIFVCVKDMVDVKKAKEKHYQYDVYILCAHGHIIVNKSIKKRSNTQQQTDIFYLHYFMFLFVTFLQVISDIEKCFKSFLIICF